MFMHTYFNNERVYLIGLDWSLITFSDMLMCANLISLVSIGLIRFL